MTTQPRTAAGVPTGGRFDTLARQDADITLAPTVGKAPVVAGQTCPGSGKPAQFFPSSGHRLDDFRVDGDLATGTWKCYRCFAAVTISRPWTRHRSGAPTWRIDEHLAPRT